VSYGRAKRRARTYTRLRRNRAPTNPRAPPGSVAAQFRDLVKKGTLEESDIERIYDTYLSPGRVTDRLDSVGSRMAAEITQVLATIDAAAGSATSYFASLADASEELQGANNNLHGGGDGIALRAVIERLIAGAKEMETATETSRRGCPPRARKSSSCSRISKSCGPRA